MADEQTKTIIAPGITIKGNITGDGDVEIHGSVQGHVQTTGSITISESGQVDGQLDCVKAKVAGFVKGQVVAGELVEIEGFIDGDVKTARLSINANGAIKGKVEMPDNDAAKNRAKRFPASETSRLPAATPTTPPAAS